MVNEITSKADLWLLSFSCPNQFFLPFVALMLLCVILLFKTAPLLRQVSCHLDTCLSRQWSVVNLLQIISCPRHLSKHLADNKLNFLKVIINIKCTCIAIWLSHFNSDLQSARSWKQRKHSTAIFNKLCCYLPCSGMSEMEEIPSSGVCKLLWNTHVNFSSTLWAPLYRSALCCTLYLFYLYVYVHVHMYQ